MRAVFVGFMVILVGTARGQFLGGIFEQGATELKEYGQQITVLGLLINQLEKGYQIEESGLDSIGGITGTEYGLHQAYFASLAAVNPVIAQMAEVSEILSLEVSVIVGMGSADGELVMGDNDRISRVMELAGRMRELAGVVEEYESGGDFLVVNRIAGARQ